jgi:hypothetical protein
MTFELVACDDGDLVPSGLVRYKSRVTVTFNM